MRPMPGLASVETLPDRERPPSQYMTIVLPRRSTVRAVTKASSSRAPRRTGKTPPLRYTNVAGFTKSCDLAMKWTLRRTNAATKKWSRKLKWFGAMITGPASGTLAVPIARPRYASQTIGLRKIRTNSYIAFGGRRRACSWNGVKYSAPRGSL